MHYVFSSIVALHSFRLKLCSVKYIAQCTLLAMNFKYLADLGEARDHAQTVKDCSSSCKIPCVIVTKDFVNPERHHNRNTGSKITAIFLKGWILPIGEVASGGVYACSLGSRLVSKALCIPTPASLSS